MQKMVKGRTIFTEVCFIVSCNDCAGTEMNGRMADPLRSTKTSFPLLLHSRLSFSYRCTSVTCRPYRSILSCELACDTGDQISGAIHYPSVLSYRTRYPIPLDLIHDESHKRSNQSFSHGSSRLHSLGWLRSLTVFDRNQVLSLENE